LAAKYLGAEAVAGEEDLIANAKARGIDPKSGMWQLPAKDVAFYAMMDVEITWQLLQKYTDGLERWGQYDLYLQRSDFQLKSLMRMEMNGMPVDVETIERHRAELAPKVAAMQESFDNFLKGKGIRLQAPDKKGLETRWINLNSPTQLVQLFNIAGYNVSASNKFVLRDLVNAGSQLAEDAVLYRQYAMADQTYYEPYLQHVDANGIIHHSLNTTGTKTGRLSSSNPNFQQIPKGGKKYTVKQVFVPRKGYVMVQFDYKALEFRLAAHIAKDENIRAAFRNGLDPHQDTANRLGLTRDRAKTLNFGLLYGMGGQKLSDQYGIPLKEAQEQARAWHNLYPSFRKTMAKAEQMAKQWRSPDGELGGKFQYIRLFNGKVKHFNEYLAYPEYPPEYRSAFNFMVQGTAAIVAEESIQRVNTLLPDNDIWKPTNAVHDALMGEIRRDKVNEVVPIIIQAMEDWPMFNPALAVEAQISDTSWYDMKDYRAEEWA
jgi:DNA polymerase-1